MFRADAARFRCRSGTCFGRLVVPLVCRSSATSSGAGAPTADGRVAIVRPPSCSDLPSAVTSPTLMPSPAAAGLDVAPDREAGAAVLEHDAGPRRDEPGAEAAVEALDPRDGGAVAVDRTEVHSAGGRLGRERRPLAPPSFEVLGFEQIGHV